MAYIFGTGSFAKHLRRVCESLNFEFDGFLELEERSASVPYFIVGKDPVNFSNTVMIGVHNPEVDVWGIKEKLTNFGFLEILEPYRALDFLSRRSGPDLGEEIWNAVELYWLSNDVSYLGDKAIIETLSQRLHDSKSREILSKTIDFRLKGDASVLPPPSQLTQQYFDSEFTQLLNLEVVLDAGAFRGDTLASLLSSESKTTSKAYIAIEPDLLNVASLLESAKAAHFKVIVAPVALGIETKLVDFNVTGEASSSVGRGGSYVVQVAGDELLGGLPEDLVPTFMKFDIEGSELSALVGLEKTIRQHCPQLAVSVYHKPHDLFDIFLYLQDLNPSYRFFLRTYGHNGFDTVLYAL